MPNYVRLLRSTYTDFKRACHDVNVDEYNALSCILVESQDMLKDVDDFTSLEGLVSAGKTATIECSTRAHAALQHLVAKHKASPMALANWLVEEHIEILQHSPTTLLWLPLCRRSKYREVLPRGNAVTASMYPATFVRLKGYTKQHEQSVMGFIRDALVVYTVQDIIMITGMDGFKDFHQEHHADGTRAVRLDRAAAAMLRLAKDQSGVSSCAILSYIVDRALAAEKINLFIAVTADEPPS